MYSYCICYIALVILAGLTVFRHRWNGTQILFSPFNVDRTLSLRGILVLLIVLHHLSILSVPHGAVFYQVGFAINHFSTILGFPQCIFCEESEKGENAGQRNLNGSLGRCVHYLKIS